MTQPLPPWWTEHEADAGKAVGFAVRGYWAEFSADDPLLAAPALRLCYGAAVSAAYREHSGLDAEAKRALVLDVNYISPSTTITSPQRLPRPAPLLAPWLSSLRG